VAPEVNVVTRHWELKLLALGFAAALWLFVMTSEKADLIVSAPIEIDGLPLGLALAGEQPENVDVQLHGLRGTLARLAPDQLKARLDMSTAIPGETTVRILPENITVPPGIIVLRINPSRIRLVLDRAPARGRAPVNKGTNGS
jgi:YbbR domain-containing protein